MSRPLCAVKTLKKGQINMKRILSVVFVLMILLLCAAPMCVSAAETTDPAYIYFVVPTEGSVAWRNFKNVYCHMWSKTGGDVYGWQEKAERCEDMGNGCWRYDMSKLDLDPEGEYSLIFSSNTGSQTSNLNITSSCLGDIVYCDGTTNINPVDGEKTCAVARWTNNNDKVHPAIETDSAGNVINIDGIAPEDAETKWGDSTGKSYELPELAPVAETEEVKPTVSDPDSANADGINLRAATTWIIIVSAVAAIIIFAFVIVLAKRNKK